MAALLICSCDLLRSTSAGRRAALFLSSGRRENLTTYYHQPSPIRPTIPPMLSALPIFFQRKLRSQVKAGVYLVGHKTQLKGAPSGQGRRPLAPTTLQRQAAALGCFFTIRVGITISEAWGSPQSSTQFYPPDFPGI